METRADYVIVGGFVVSLLIGMVVAALWVAHIEFNQHQTYYDIYFSGSVQGLNQGSAVRENGIPVGRITTIELDPRNPQRVRVTAEVGANAVIKADAVAKMEFEGLTGGAYIELDGGSEAAPPLEVHGDERYPVIPSKQSVLQQVAESAPEVLDKLMSLANEATDVLNDKNRAAISQMLDDLQHVTGVAAAHKADLDRMFSDGAVAVQELRTTLDTANHTLEQLRQMTANGGDVQVAVKSVNQLIAKLDGLTGHIDELVQENRPPLREFTGRGLNELDQLLADTRVLVGELTRVGEMIERDPTQVLYGDRRGGYQPK